MSRQQKKRTWGQCAYCGRHDLMTVDHVVPRCLFDGANGGVPGDVPKALVCQTCNVEKSQDDEYLRVMLVNDSRLALHPLAQDIRHSAVARSLARGRIPYSYDTLPLRYVTVPTGSGLIIAEPILPKDRLRRIFVRLVCGLMAAYEQYNLPSSVGVDVLRARDSIAMLDEAHRWAESDTSGMVHLKQVGDGTVFWCVYYRTHSPEQPNLSQWWLRFYERAAYLVLTDMTNLSLGEV